MKNMEKNYDKTDMEAGRVKTYTLLYCAALISMFVMAMPLKAAASSMPDELGEWRLVSEYVTNLTASDDLGRWTSASYVRSAPLAEIEVQLTEGAGPGALFVPDSMVSTNDGPIGFLSAYETVVIAGIRAVHEQSGVMGQALAVPLEERTVTFESRGILNEELFGFAENMIKALRKAQ